MVSYRSFVCSLQGWKEIVQSARRLNTLWCHIEVLFACIQGWKEIVQSARRLNILWCHIEVLFARYRDGRRLFSLLVGSTLCGVI